MQPSNQQERKKAFWNFLLFFCITVGVIVVTMLFSFQVPFKERDMLRKKADATENHELILMKFAQGMDSIINMIDNLENEKNSFIMKNRIEKNIDDLSDVARSDSTWMREMLINVAANLKDLTSTKLSLLSVNDCKAALSQKDETIANLVAELNVCRQKLKLKKPTVTE